MDGRERWQALQAHLVAARRALADGDEARALDEVQAALAIDPEFVAARALRDRIDRPAPETAAGADSSAAVAASREPPRPLVSAEGFARFEARARRRRIERRADAARAAIDGCRLADAAAAIDEIRDLDPNAPEIAALAAAVDRARQARVERWNRRQRGPQMAAVAAFAAVLLAASWVEQPQGLLAYPISIVTALIATAEPAPLIATSPADEETMVATSGRSAAETQSLAAAETDVASPRAMSGSTPAPIGLAVSQPPPAASTTASSSAAPPEPISPPAPPPAAVAPLSTARPAEPPPIEARADDDALVRRALQQYRDAYDTLDAQSARAVWPVVNERALARAFDGLESQRLTFDACDVQVAGDEATATCRGAARYVAKIGSREPRVEPRVWNFTLRKLGADWKIENARAER